jgi:O-glycosyl hydrolase
MENKRETQLIDTRPIQEHHDLSRNRKGLKSSRANKKKNYEMAKTQYLQRLPRTQYCDVKREKTVGRLLYNVKYVSD